MRHETAKCKFCILLFLTFFLVIVQPALAQSYELILEKEQHWENYGGRNTTMTGGSGQNLFVGDVDSDGVMEIITGGVTGNLANLTLINWEAPLKIWSWNGKNLTLEKSFNWRGSIGCVFAGDANGDGKIEIITAGRLTNSTGSYAQLRIWQWDGQVLVLKSSYDGKVDFTGASMRYSGAVYVFNGVPEIITVGRFYNGNASRAQMCAWRYDGYSLSRTASVEWDTADNSSWGYSTSVSDLNSDGVSEIVTTGYAGSLKNSSGELRIWQFNGESFSLKADTEWRLKNDGYGLTISGSVMGNTIVSHVEVGDVDDDGSPEIVTGGFAWNGEKIAAQLIIWSWNGQTLTLEKSQEWTTEDITEIKSMSIADVDSDGKKEIVTSGVTSALGSFNSESPSVSQLRVWRWDENTLTLKCSADWYVGKGSCAWNVATGALHKKGVTEMVTLGTSNVEDTVSDPDMRIWSIAVNSAPFQYSFLVVIVIVVVIVIAIILFLAKKRRK